MVVVADRMSWAIIIIVVVMVVVELLKFIKFMVRLKWLQELTNADEPIGGVIVLRIMVGLIIGLLYFRL